MQQRYIYNIQHFGVLPTTDKHARNSKNNDLWALLSLGIVEKSDTWQHLIY
jgi:hypothetical protein